MCSSGSRFFDVFSPHLCVGFLFLILCPARPPPPPPALPPHTIFHTQLGPTPSFTHNFVTRHLSRTTWSHTIFHIQLCHTPSFTHNVVTHYLSTFSHTRAGVSLMALGGSGGAFGAPWSRGDAAALCVAGDIYRRFAWQTWHLATSTVVLATSTFVSRGRHGTYGTGAGCGGTLAAPRSRGDAATLCVAGVALGDIYRRFAWQAWHLATSTVVLATSTFVSRGRRVTYGTGLALVARLGPLGRAVMPQHFAWQAWHFDIYRRFAELMALGWLWWRAWGPLVAGWHPGTLRGRRGTWRHLPSLCVAGVALGRM